MNHNDNKEELRNVNTNKYYNDSYKTENGFNLFHTEILNFPRENFSTISEEKLIILAKLFIYLENKIYNNSNELRKEVIKNPKNSKILNSRVLKSLETATDKKRAWRHLIEYCCIFSLIEYDRNKITINFDNCKEMEMIKNSDNFYFQNKLLSLNIKSNNYLRRLKSLRDENLYNYNLTEMVLTYIYDLKRDVTDFEVAFLLGKIEKAPENKDFNKIYKRAIEIGSKLPPKKSEQMKYIFNMLNWKHDDEKYFRYKNSQNPEHKLKSYFNYLKAARLINYNKDILSLTDTSIELIESKLPLEIINVYKFLNNKKDIKEIEEHILKNRKGIIKDYIKNDKNFCKKINVYNLKNGKKQRSYLISEMAKIQDDYKCQVSNKHFIETQKDRFYIEAHHIIPLSEDGLDITDNLVSLCPNAHKILHEAKMEYKKSIYKKLKNNNRISFSLFKDMFINYEIKSKKPLEYLANNYIISVEEKEELLNFINDPPKI